MSKLDNVLKEAVTKQYQTQKKNLLSVARLCIQTICDESSNCGVIDDNSETLNNLCTIIESILCHGFKVGTGSKKTGYGPEAIQYWDFIRLACKSVPYNCIEKIQQIDVKTLRGKGRAWIRMSLMEKRLSEYFSVALMEDTIIKRFYERGSFMANEEAHIFTNVANALNTVDFSLCLRNNTFDLPVVFAVDYSQFIKYPISDRQLDIEETLLRLERNRHHNDASSTCSGHTSVSEREPHGEEELSKLRRSIKLVVDQKAYLEEILKLKDLKCTELTQQLLDWDKQVEDDRRQSEDVILELQNQLSEMHQKNRLLLEKIEDLKRDANYDEMEAVQARSRYSVNLHRPSEGIDVVAEMDRNGYCSKSSSEQSIRRLQDSNTLWRSNESVKRSSETLLTRTSSHSGAERPGPSSQRKPRSSSTYNK